jgi:hypothetical protein
MVKNSSFNNINSFKFLKKFEKKVSTQKTLGLVGLRKGYKKASPFLLYLREILLSSYKLLTRPTK